MRAAVGEAVAGRVWRRRGARDLGGHTDLHNVQLVSTGMVFNLFTLGCCCGVSPARINAALLAVDTEASSQKCIFSAKNADTPHAHATPRYLPQGPGALGIHRLLWQVQYLVSQGFYVILDYHPTASSDPNMLDPAAFAANWGRLWAALAGLGAVYQQQLRGRVIADLVNEAR